MIRVEIPYHLRNLAGETGEIELEVGEPVCVRTILDALESRHPVLRGTIRDIQSHRRRDFVRFFVCGEDWSHTSLDQPLPDAVARGLEPLIVLGAMAGG